MIDFDRCRSISGGICRGRKKKRENLESGAALPISIHRPRAISSPRAGRRNVSRVARRNETTKGGRQIGAKNQTYPKKPYKRFTRRPGRLSRPNTWVWAAYPPALRGSAARSTQIPGYRRFNRPAWAGQPPSAARKPSDGGLPAGISAKVVLSTFRIPA
ncbi:hypothetical protein GW17_00042483 [Ensete ventricosum]|nr:hypothetical protein GW17_00042483 [Ensete ventricosum]RZS15253.1 hypothetical protein BHM03_00047062 [Ensete ventricosum]